MQENQSRRSILTTGLALGAGLILPRLSLSQAAPKKPRPPKLPDEQVKEFVKAAHVDLELTKKMLTEQPKLLNATWDWSNGDFEMAIGGAGHMGRKDIASFLIGQGGRFDLFVAAMMDEIDIVKPILAAHPDLVHSKGPHGIPLMAHAEQGEAKRVIEYLKSLTA